MNPPLRVALLHNYRDEQQPSMRLYAERLGDALRRRHVHVTRIRPPGVVPDSWRRGSLFWSKLDSYAGRYAVYPRLLRNIDADVVHIVDHGKGIWSAVSIAVAPSSPVTTSSCWCSRPGASAAPRSPRSRCSCSGSRSNT